MDYRHAVNVEGNPGRTSGNVRVNAEALIRSTTESSESRARHDMSARFVSRSANLTRIRVRAGKQRALRSSGARAPVQCRAFVLPGGSIGGRYAVSSRRVSARRSCYLRGSQVRRVTRF
jgi:hypothetical protein